MIVILFNLKICLNETFMGNTIHWQQTQDNLFISHQHVNENSNDMFIAQVEL